MVNHGRPSAGCGNCRRAKKSCDRKVPSCDRCSRLGKICGGYRDLSELMFRDQSTEVIRRASTGEGSSRTTSPLGGSHSPPSQDSAARLFFQERFVTATFLPFLSEGPSDEHLSRSILACAYAAMANGDNEAERTTHKQKARTLYVEALSATNALLKHNRRMKEDTTLISVLLLGLFEKLVWDGVSSVSSWKHHIGGATQMIELRGRSQIRTKIGAQLFREVRNHIITDALWSETAVPETLARWTHALEFEPLQIHSDQISILAGRVSSLREHFCAGEETDQLLLDTATRIDAELLAWSEQALIQGSACLYSTVQDQDSHTSWNGTRHDYSTPQAREAWNEWRCLRIIVSRIQEAIWRRSWPTLERQPEPNDADHHANLRARMAAGICVATAGEFPNTLDATSGRGAVGSAYLCIFPLFLAGTVALEHLASSITTPGNTRALLCNQAFHLDPLDRYSTQLAWIIARLDYISTKVGISWAAALSACLKGDLGCHYNIARSRVTRTESNNEMLIT
ncbi:hypothetical protein K431DRAFT_280584 [Polychaeton citri CBS 116435]|uniref:Zn(2)-C6 fungal-type domain-containing protein n=1 Tax=Polychaeton citri CBS 116435 TaxID=1314669 RepID=A0A9P4QJF2_9PEZI|nr:hypothetical protein K431DRAFT_280584 [Polychaeton citri CBS 116435]